MKIDRILLLKIGKFFFFVEAVKKEQLTYFVCSKLYDRLMKIGLEIIYNIIMNYPEDIFVHVNEPKSKHVFGYVQFFRSKGINENHPGKKKKLSLMIYILFTLYIFLLM